MITFQGVPSSDCGVWWPGVSHWIEQALEHGPKLYDRHDVRAEIEAGDMKLWVICSDQMVIGTVVTSIQQYPRRKALIIGPVGGISVRRWIKSMDQHLRNYAASEGCDVEISEGRPGWDRFVGNGWVVTSTQYVREIAP